MDGWSRTSSSRRQLGSLPVKLFEEVSKNCACGSCLWHGEEVSGSTESHLYRLVVQISMRRVLRSVFIYSDSFHYLPTSRHSWCCATHSPDTPTQVGKAQRQQAMSPMASVSVRYLSHFAGPSRGGPLTRAG